MHKFHFECSAVSKSISNSNSILLTLQKYILYLKPYGWNCADKVIELCNAGIKNKKN